MTTTSGASDEAALAPSAESCARKAEHDTSAIGRENSRDEVQERCFARAAASDEADLFTIGESKRRDINHRHRRRSGAMYCFFKSRSSTAMRQTIPQACRVCQL